MSDQEAAGKLGRSFLRILIEDVLAARERLVAGDTEGRRRDCVRATFAAIEGATWLYREHVREIARSIGVLTPMADLALQERSFAVSDKGDIIEQVRFITLPTILRLTTKQAKLIDPDAGLALDGEGWAKLRASIEIRHRVTHPKTSSDLRVTDEDLQVVATAFAWLLGSIVDVMDATANSFKLHVDAARDLIDALKSGKQEALDDYRQALMAGETD